MLVTAQEKRVLGLFVQVVSIKQHTVFVDISATDETFKVKLGGLFGQSCYSSLASAEFNKNRSRVAKFTFF